MMFWLRFVWELCQRRLFEEFRLVSCFQDFLY